MTSKYAQISCLNRLHGMRMEYGQSGIFSKIGVINVPKLTKLYLTV